MHKVLIAFGVWMLVWPAAAQMPPEKAAVSRVRRAPVDAAGRVAFVRVEDAPLYFSHQVFARDVFVDARAQTEQVIDLLADDLARVGGDLESVLRLNVSVAYVDDLPRVEAVLAARLAGHAPAVTWVCTPLAVPGARVAIDGIALVSRAAAGVEWIEGAGAVLPAGAKVFVSGQLERGADPAASVRLTMEGLHRTIDHLGLAKRDVVQVKVFLQPFAEHPAALREIAASFGGGASPPVILVEWVSTEYAEIEMIVSGGSLRSVPTEVLTFVSLPGKSISPRFSHVAVVSAGTPLIFLGGIDAGPGLEPREQWKRIFERLGSTLFESGSSFRHLVKATYYLEDSPARGVLNEIRATYYDPSRPPAASAVGVRRTGRPDRAFHLDMIAVPLPGPK